MAGYFEEPPEPTPQIDYREMMEAFDAAMKTAEREEAARRKQAKIYDAARKDIQKTLDDAKKVLGDVEFTRAMSQERMTPSELYRWSKQMERKHKALEKRCREKGIDYLEQDTEEAARRAKENAARRNITRAKAMLASIDAATSQMAADTQINFSKTLKTEGLKSAKQEEKTLEIGFDIDLDSISPAKVKALVDEDFYGGNYTNKIRRSRDKLNRELERCIRLGQVNGWSIDRLSKEMVKRVGINEREANRLLRTEMTRVSNEAALEQLKSCGARFYKYIAAMDSRTCERCKAIHGHVFAIDKAKAGENFPPLHPNCRCRIVINAENETGEYDASYVDDIVDENIRKALDKWASEGIDVLPEVVLSPSSNDYGRPSSLLELPPPAYMTRWETRFNESVLSKYGEPGVRHLQFMRIYLDSMRGRGIPDEFLAVISRMYTSSVWEVIPPPYFLFDRSAIFSSFDPSNNTLTMSCNYGSQTLYVLAHELTHFIDFSVLRKPNRINTIRRIKTAISHDTRAIFSEGITLGGTVYTTDILKQLSIDVQAYWDALRNGARREFIPMTNIHAQFVQDIGNTIGTRSLEFIDGVMALILDTIQSILGFEYGVGHEQPYCLSDEGYFTEAVANCGAAYMWGLDSVFSAFFPNGFNSISGELRHLSIRPMKRR